MSGSNPEVKDSVLSIRNLIITCLGALGIAHAEPSSKEIRLVAEDSWPPYSDKNAQGLSTALVSAAYHISGNNVVLDVMPYARVVRSVRAGLSDGGYNITRQSSTEDLFLFGSEVLLTANAFFYFKAGSGANYKSYNDIPNGSRVGLVIGYDYGDIYQVHAHRFTEVRVTKQRHIIKMLKAGRIDAAIMFDEVAAYNLRDLNISVGAIDKGFMNHTSDIYVGFSLKRSASARNAELLDEGLRLLRKSGEYDRLVDDYLGIGRI